MTTRKPKASAGAAQRAAAPDEAMPDRPVQKLDLDRLPTFMGYALRRAQLVVFEQFARDFAEIGLRPAQFTALYVIQHNPGRKQSEIAAALGIQRTNFVSMMDEFERRGLTHRGKSADDRRAHAISLTEKGEKLLNKATTTIDIHERRWIDLLGQDNVDCLLKTLRAFM